MKDVPNQTATVNTAFNLALAGYATPTDGDAITSYTLSGTLPAGLSFNATTGVLSGTPTATGTYTLAATARDKDGLSNSDGFTLTINDLPDTTAPSKVSESFNFRFMKVFFNGSITFDENIAKVTSVSIS